MDEKIPIDISKVRGAAEFLQQLDRYIHLQGRYGDVTSSKYKRMLASYVLSIVNDFFQQHPVQNHVVAGLDSVIDGLLDLNRDVISSVMKCNPAPNRPVTPIEVEKIRAQIAALVHVLTQQNSISGGKKAPVARDLLRRLQPELGRIADQSDETSRPERYLTNLAGKYARGSIKDEVSSFHFRYWSERMEAAFNKIEPERRSALIAALISDIKARISKLPKTN